MSSEVVKAEVIPEDWEILPLEKIAEVIMGQSPAGISYNQNCIGMPLINGPTEFTDKYPKKIQWTTQPTKICKENEILLCVRGSSTGRMNISDDIYCIGRGIAAIRAKSGIDPTYLEYQMISAIRDLLTLSVGSTFPNIDGKSIRSIQVTKPPFPEQTAIAAALSDADALITSLNRLIAKKRDIKQAAMQELLTGKKRLPGFEIEMGCKKTEIGMIPEDWDIQKLGDIGECLIGLTYKPDNVRKTGLLVLRSSNIKSDSLQYDDNVFVNIDVPDKIIVQIDDILICVRNGSRSLIGKCALINEKAEGMTFGAFMSVFRTKYGRFVFYQFQSNSIKKQIHEHLGATINQITNKSLNSFLISLPSDEKEQTAIATVLSDMDAEIAELEEKRDKARMIKEGMMQELLTGRIRLV